MNDSFLMRGLERVHDLTCDRQRLVHRHRLAMDPFVERLTWDELHHQEVTALGFLETVERRDVGMIQRR